MKNEVNFVKCVRLKGDVWLREYGEYGSLTFFSTKFKK